MVEKPVNLGASLSILGGHERSASLVGTNGWTFLATAFDATDRTQVTVAVRRGHHYSTATDRAWFDHLCLVELEPDRH